MTDLLKAIGNVQAAVTRPTTQKSSLNPTADISAGSSVPGWNTLSLWNDTEETPAWFWPECVRTVERMGNDSQVAALKQAIALPMASYIVELDPQAADPTDASLIAADLDMPMVGQEFVNVGRRRDKFSLRRHFSRALEALWNGAAVFEHVGTVDNGLWRFVDLAPVPPRTIGDWKVDRFGRLQAVEQNHTIPPVSLETDRLSVYTWQGKPGDPRGRSMLRPLYGHFLLRDRLMRIDAIKHERNGMGIPVGTMPRDDVAGAKEQLEGLLAGLAAGEDTALVLPYDSRLQLMGVTGQLPDTIGSLKYHDEGMARAMLAMVLQLGQTETGSRALGGTFNDLLSMFHDAVMDWFCSVLTEQAVEPWMDRNRGEGSLAPAVVWRRAEDQTTTVSYQYDLDYGIITRNERRAQLGLPPLEEGGDELAVPATQRDPVTGDPVPVPATAAAPKTPAKVKAAATAGDRVLRREKYDHEIKAATDFDALEADYLSTRDQLTAALVEIRAELAAAAVAAVGALDALDPASLATAVAGAMDDATGAIDRAGLVAVLTSAASTGAAQIGAEARSQDVDLDVPAVDYDALAELEADDLVGRMARQVTESAASAVRSGVAPDATAEIAAAAVAANLEALTPAAAEQAASGATSRATNVGRATAIDASPYRSVYASELLDTNTCSECSSVDGREYQSLEDALKDYPAGGYFACEGGERCRGTLVAVMDTEQEAVT